MLTNCIFSGNQADGNGGGTHEMDSTTRLINCTFSGNSAGYWGGALCSGQGSRPKLTNCILWGDTGDEIFVQGGQPLVTYSNIQTTGHLPWPGEGNIYADPCFAKSGYWDPNGTLDNADDDFWVDDYRLSSQVGRWDPNSQEWVQDNVTSPCIDAGNPGCSLVDEPNEPGNLRVNMGAHGGTAQASKTPAGWRSIADLTNDWLVDFSDFEAFACYWRDRGQFIPSDLNRDWSVDVSDFAVFASNWLEDTER